MLQFNPCTGLDPEFFNRIEPGQSGKSQMATVFVVFGRPITGLSSVHLKNNHRSIKFIPVARVCTYLNFPRNTELAFNFYKSVFGGEFGGMGVARFQDIPSKGNMPPLADEDKNLILYIELPIIGGHVLMGTEAPDSLGFTLLAGNNVHIDLEPDTRKETIKLFDALSAGGKITMALQDIFWGRLLWKLYGSIWNSLDV
jgi:PhnB protein